MKLSLLPTLIVLITLITGCSDDSSNNVDTQAPAISFLAPADNDTVGVDQFTVVFSVSDNVGVTKIELFIDGEQTPSKTISGSPWQAGIDIRTMANGPHTIVAKASDAAGNATSTNALTFIKGIKSVNALKRMALVEIITSANCAPCGPANEAFRFATGNAFYDERMAVIKYHVPIPRSSDSLWKASETWSRPRKDYLFGTMTQSAPNAWVSGTFATNVVGNWVTALDQNIAKPADASIQLSKAVSGDRVTLAITVKGINSSTYNDLRLHTVLTHSNIQYNDGNSEFEHFEVMSMMLPDANGETITLGNGEEKSFTREFTLKSAWRIEDMEAIVFLQSHNSMYVLQAAKISLK